MIQAVIFDMFETLITHYQCPLYFSKEMAEDANMSQEQFQALWRPTEVSRSTGKLTFEETIEMILRKNNCYSKALLNTILQKRIATKENCFRHLNPEILPVLQTLKEQGILIGLISNCFSEEAAVIRKSALFPYFDAPYLSYEQGIQKPDEEIFWRCIKALKVRPEACLYIGDGGSYELETARKLGMHALQAVWYLREDTLHPVSRKNDFIQLERPLDLLKYLK